MSQEAIMGQEQGNVSTGERSCTCHPNDNPPVPCPRKYALRECRTAAVHSELLARVEELREALERLLRFNDDLCSDIGVSKHYPSAEKARAALARAAQPLPHGGG